MFDWNDLRVFLGVARAGTLSAAARRLQVDQSTVGRRLGLLEAAVGTRLFERTRDGYCLSPAGEAVLASVQTIEEQAIAVERTLVGRDARIEGKVRLATSDSFGVWFLARQLPELKRRLPGIELELITGNQPVDLAKREADISLRLSKPTQAQLVARRLAKAAWAVYGATSYLAERGEPDLKRRFQGHDVLGFGDELAGTLGATWLREFASAGRQVFSSNSLLCQAAAVVQGLGLCPLPCLMGDVEPKLQRALPAVIGSHELWMVVHPDVRGNAKLRAVMGFLSERVLAEASLLAGTLVQSSSRRARSAKSSRRG